jgi:hypothetical protein
LLVNIVRFVLYTALVDLKMISTNTRAAELDELELEELELDDVLDELECELDELELDDVLDELECELDELELELVRRLYINLPLMVIELAPENIFPN